MGACLCKRRQPQAQCCQPLPLPPVPPQLPSLPAPVVPQIPVQAFAQQVYVPQQRYIYPCGPQRFAPIAPPCVPPPPPPCQPCVPPPPPCQPCAPPPCQPCGPPPPPPCGATAAAVAASAVANQATCHGRQVRYHPYHPQGPMRPYPGTMSSISESEYQFEVQFVVPPPQPPQAVYQPSCGATYTTQAPVAAPMPPPAVSYPSAYPSAPAQQVPYFTNY